MFSVGAISWLKAGTFASRLRQIHTRLGQEQILDPLHLGLLEQDVNVSPS